MGWEHSPHARFFLLASIAVLLLFLFGCPYAVQGQPGAGQAGGGGAPAAGAGPAAAAVAAKSYDAIAVWQHQGKTFDVWYSVWDHDAKKWFTPSGKVSEPIAADAGDDHDADVSTNGKDMAIAAWSKVSGGKSTIYYSIWEDGTWSSPSALSKEGADTDPTVAMDTAGNALAAWVSGGDKLHYAYYADGIGWGAPSELKLAGGMSKVSLPELAYGEADGNYYLVFTARTGDKVSAHISTYSAGAWTSPSEASGAAVLDDKAPTDERTGMAAAKGKAEATAVFAGQDGKVYSMVPGAAAKSFGENAMPDDAYDSKDVANGAFSKASGIYHQPNVNSPGSEAAISSLKSEMRPSLTFIRSRAVGLVVWWTSSVAPGEIFYSYGEGGAWSAPKDLDSSLKGELDRNPAVSPLSMKEKKKGGPYCGDGVLAAPEQCEAGIACANPNAICNLADCTCKETPYNYTCGDGFLDFGEQCEAGIACPKAGQVCQIPPCICKDKPKNDSNVSCAANTAAVDASDKNSFNAAAMRCQDDCKKKLGDEYECNGQSCTCTKKPSTAISCAQNTKSVNSPAGIYQKGMFCRDDCAALNKYWVCDPEGCFCKESRTVTPRCGDGYVSGPNSPGGGFEECDVGFGFYQPKDSAGNPLSFPDTCTLPKHCDPPTCKCVGPVTENTTTGNQTENRTSTPFCGNDLREGSEQCDGTDRGSCSSGQGCNSQCQCYTPYTPPTRVCGNGVKEPGEACDSNSDCVQQFGGQSVGGTCSDSCATCTYNLYCGDGIVYGNEQCEQNSQCSQGYVCSGCACVPAPKHSVCDYSHQACVQVDGAGTSECSVDSDCAPPVVDCPAYCSSQGYSQSLGSGYQSAQECSAAAQESPTTCFTTCTYTKFYTASNQAGTTSCCCKAKQMLACTDCPGQNPVCPSQSSCDQYAPRAG